MPIDILFVAYGGGHVAMLEPVYRRLKGKYATNFLALTTAQRYLQDRGLEYMGFTDLEGAHDPETIALGRSLVPQGAGTNAAVPEAETLAYHGLNMRDLIAVHGIEQASGLFEAKGRQAFLPVPSLVGLMQQLRPRLVVATNSPRAEKATFIAARQLGIPSICVVDLFAMQELEWLSNPDFASRTLVINEQVRDSFVRAGVDPSTVFASGNPAFDAINAPETMEAGRALRADWAFKDDVRVILWASQVEPSRHPFTNEQADPTLPRRIEDRLRDMLASHPNWRLVVRYHPSEQVSFAPHDQIVHSPSTQPLHHVLHAVDAAVVMTSTVGVEAAIAGKPVLSVDMSVFTPDAPYSDMGISTGVTSLDEIEPVLENLLSRSTQEFEIAPVGAATQVIAHIEEILEVSHRQ